MKAKQFDYPRKIIAIYGAKCQAIRVFVERGGNCVRVQWHESKGLKTKSWPNTRLGKVDAKIWACRIAELQRISVLNPVVTLPKCTVQYLWERYRIAECDQLGQKTINSYVAHWRLWMQFVGGDSDVEAVTADLLSRFRQWLNEDGYAISRQRGNIGFIKQVFRWGVLCELITRDRLSLFRFQVSKAERPKAIPEYNPQEYQRLVSQFDPRVATQWRAWVLLILLGELGPRINAALHLQWDDIDFNRGEFGTIIWRGTYDKLGRERTQPLTAQARDALYVALGWARLVKRAIPWVFYSIRADSRSPYTVQGFWWMLRKAEDQARIPHVLRGAAHRLRRMAAGNALEVTGNVADAMWWIGDTDLRQARKYLTPRDYRMRDIASRMSQFAKSTGEKIPKHAR